MQTRLSLLRNDAEYLLKNARFAPMCPLTGVFELCSFIYGELEGKVFGVTFGIFVLIWLFTCSKLTDECGGGFFYFLILGFVFLI